MIQRYYISCFIALFALNSVFSQADAISSASTKSLPVIEDPSEVPLPVFPLDDKGLIIVSESQSSRVRACDDVATEYRPTLDGPLNPDFAEPFLKSCFSRPAALEKALLARIRSTVVHIAMGRGRGTCSGIVVSQWLLVTARHCFKDQQDTRGRLNFNALSSAEVQGVSKDGITWNRKGLMSHYDPHDSIPTIEEVSLRKQFSRASLDYLFLKTKDERGFPLPTVSFVTPGHQKQIKFRTSLIVASYVPSGSGKIRPNQLYVNNLADCIALGYEPRSGILRHRCQTLPSFSGAPIFVRTGPQNVELFAVHSGGTGVITNQSYADQGNEAVVIDELNMRAVSSRPLE
jgi:hypothetical protein